MTTEQLQRLYDSLTETRDTANRAYDIALKNRKTNNDTTEAFRTVVLTNQLRDTIYNHLCSSIAKGEDHG